MNDSAAPFYERLDVMDASWLELEDASCHMLIGCVEIYERNPGAEALDITQARRAIAARLHLVPRLRQRLAYEPFTRTPLWIDDEHFDIRHHVRRRKLPPPGNDLTLKELAGLIMSEPLDRRRPLWEVWFVEGLDNDRFALVVKTHHCVTDGVSGAEVLGAFFEADAAHTPADPMPWRPRAQPTEEQLRVNEIRRRVRHSANAVTNAMTLVRHPEAAIRKLWNGLNAFAEAGAALITPASWTPFNVGIGAFRRFDWTEMSLEDVKNIKRLLGGTVNDVVLATVSGALRQILAEEHLDPNALDVRALIPINVRSEDENRQMGNRIAPAIASLYVNLGDPLKRLAAVSRTMVDRKGANRTLIRDVATQLGEWTVPGLIARIARIAQYGRPYNLMISNIVGAPVPLYFAGHALRSLYPVVPVYQNLAVVIAVWSYSGRLCWGFTADAGIRNLARLVSAVQHSFLELKQAAERRPPPVSRRADRVAKVGSVSGKKSGKAGPAPGARVASVE